MVIEFLNRELPLYGIFFWLGILLAGMVAIFIAKKNNIKPLDIFISGVYTMIASVIGAKLLYFIVSWSDIMHFINVTAPSLNYKTSDIVLTLIQGGFVFYGGFIGGALALLIYARTHKVSLKGFAGIYAVVLPLGHALGRVGCFFGGCCYGIKYDGPLSYTYSDVHSAAPTGVPLFPVQLLEAFCLFILFTVLLIIFLKSDNRNTACICTYAFSYSVIRFVLEFFRGDIERGGIGPISTSQLISILIFAIAIVSLIISNKRKHTV